MIRYLRPPWFMLDTNIVSRLARRNALVTRRIAEVPMESLCLSAVTAGELIFGLAKRPEEMWLHEAVTQLLLRVDVLPWDLETAERYGAVRAEMERRGKVIGKLDLMIGSHALAVGAVLVTNDRAFRHVVGLRIEDWTT